MKKRTITIIAIIVLGLSLKFGKKPSELTMNATPVEPSIIQHKTNPSLSLDPGDAPQPVGIHEQLLAFLLKSEVQSILHPPAGDSEIFLNENSGNLMEVIKTSTQLSALLSKCLLDNQCIPKRDAERAFYDETNTTYHRMLAQTLRTLKSAIGRTQDRTNFPAKQELLTLLNLQNDEVQSVAISILTEMPNSTENYPDILAQAPKLNEMAKANFFVTLEPLSRTSAENRDNFIRQIVHSLQTDDTYTSTLVSKSLSSLNLNQGELESIAKGLCGARRNIDFTNSWGAFRRDFEALHFNLNRTCTQST